MPSSLVPCPRAYNDPAAAMEPTAVVFGNTANPAVLDSFDFTSAAATVTTAFTPAFAGQTLIATVSNMVWIAQDAPREVQDRFFSRVRRYELKIEHVVDREFDDEAEWCRCGAKS